MKFFLVVFKPHQRLSSKRHDVRISLIMAVDKNHHRAVHSGNRLNASVTHNLQVSLLQGHTNHWRV